MKEKSDTNTTRKLNDYLFEAALWGSMIAIIILAAFFLFLGSTLSPMLIFPVLAALIICAVTCILIAATYGIRTLINHFFPLTEVNDIAEKNKLTFSAHFLENLKEAHYNFDLSQKMGIATFAATLLITSLIVALVAFHIVAIPLSVLFVVGLLSGLLVGGIVGLTSILVKTKNERKTSGIDPDNADELSNGIQSSAQFTTSSQIYNPPIGSSAPAQDPKGKNEGGDSPRPG